MLEHLLVVGQLSNSWINLLNNYVLPYNVVASGDGGRLCRPSPNGYGGPSYNSKRAAENPRHTGALAPRLAQGR
eukprot:4647542-Prymnesium_polylepis.1